MAFILRLRDRKYIESEIVLASISNVPLKKDGWQFDWKTLLLEKKSKTYLLRLSADPRSIEGALQLKIENNMLIMNNLEIAPHNIGSKNKRFDYVAGCLIAYACRESFNINGNYKGFLTFVSKSSLIGLYQKKYGATIALGRRMFIDDVAGMVLIEKYLE